MLSWTIGNILVACIQESENDIPADLLLPGLTAGQVAAIEWLDPRFLGAGGMLRLAIQALVLRDSRSADRGRHLPR